MISLDAILEWKHTYENVYQIEILGEHYIFRSLGREEYKQIILMDFNLAEFQEIICATAVIYPEERDYSKGLAGIAEVLSEVILDASGLLVNQAGELLANFRSEMDNYDYQVDCLIHEAFPEFTLEEISTWSVRKTMYYLSRSEWVLKVLKGVPLGYVEQTAMQNYQEEYYEEEQYEEEPQEVPQEKPLPYTRPIRKELIEGPEEEPQPKDKAKQQQGDIDSEQAVLAMLGQTGHASKPITDMSKERIPELGWFSYMDELKGEFD